MGLCLDTVLTTFNNRAHSVTVNKTSLLLRLHSVLFLTRNIAMGIMYPHLDAEPLNPRSILIIKFNSVATRLYKVRQIQPLIHDFGFAWSEPEYFIPTERRDVSVS